MENENDKIHNIPIDFIDDPDLPIRSRANEESIYDLADSIRDVGLIQPLTVRAKGDRFEVIAGHRRLIASRIAGLPLVPCILRRVKDVDCELIRLHENLGREDVNVVDQSRFFNRVMEKLNLSVSELAQKMKRNESFVRDRLALLSWPDEVIEAVNNQKISFSAAKWIAKIGVVKVRRHYLDAAIKSGISARVAYDWFQSWDRNKLPKPPSLVEKPRSEEKEEIQYYFSRCKFCDEKIAMGDEEVIYVHRKCLEEIERQVGQQKE